MKARNEEEKYWTYRITHCDDPGGSKVARSLSRTLSSLRIDLGDRGLWSRYFLKPWLLKHLAYVGNL
jgi:hypothetical protein